MELPENIQQKAFAGLDAAQMAEQYKAHKYECHRKYIDIQYVIGGEETIYVCRKEDLRDCLREYSEKKDAEIFAGAVAQTGYVMNSDPHMPGCVPPSGAGHVRKVVVKVPMAE